MSHPVKGYLNRIFHGVVNWFPADKLKGLLFRIAAARADTLPADEALRFLFRLDGMLYNLQGRQSVRYGNGVHSKHRHLRYHDFFTARVQPGDRVLDVGSSIGLLALKLADDSGAIVTGVDIVPERVAEARERYGKSGLEFHVCDITKSIPDGRFDVVVLSNVLEHLPDRSALLRKLSDTTGAKKMLVRVPLFERDWRVPLKKELGVDWRLDSTHFTEYTLDSFAREIEEAGLSVGHLEVHWGELWAELTCPA